jgi:hypothetical protein
VLTGPRASPRPRSSSALAPAARVAVASAVLALAAAGTAAGSEFVGKADLGAGYDDDTWSSRDYLRQVYQLGWAHRVSDPIDYRLTLLYQDDRGTLTIPDGRQRLQSRQLSPAGYLNWTLDGFSLSLSASVFSGAVLDQTSDRMISQTIERYAAASRVRILENADLTASAGHLAFSGAGVDTVQDSATVGFDWETGPFKIINENRGERYVDARYDITRTTVGPQVSARYAQAGQDWAVGARYDLGYILTEQRALAATARIVPSDTLPVAGLYSVNSLPASSPPMAPEARLVDGMLDASAGVNVGAGGAPFQNVGVDMGRTVTLDELRISVRNAGGQPVPFGGAVTWSVWSSADGMRWALVAGQTETFSTVMSAYVLGFPSTSARYFKAVNFGVNTVDTLVTEVQTFVRESFIAGQTLVGNTVNQGLGLNVSAKVAPKAAVSYIGQAHVSSATGFDGEARRSGDTTNQGTVTLGPFGDFKLDVSAIQFDVRSGTGAGQSRLVFSGGSTYQPVERFSARVEGYRSLDRVGAIRATTTGGTVSSTASVYDSLLAAAAVGLLRQDLATGEWTEVMTGTGNVVAHVRIDLELRMNASVQRTVAEAGNPQGALASAPVLQNFVYQRYTGDLRYRPSGQLELQGRVGYAATPIGDGILRAARVAWNPFPGGNVQLGFDYEVEFDTLTGRAYRQVSVHPQWLINRHATLLLRYNDVRWTGDTFARQQSVSLGLSMTL